MKAASDLPLCTEISPLHLSNNTWEENQGEIRHHYQTECEAQLFPVSTARVFFYAHVFEMPASAGGKITSISVMFIDSLKTHSAIKMWQVLRNRMHNITQLCVPEELGRSSLSLLMSITAAGIHCSYP